MDETNRTAAEAHGRRRKIRQDMNNSLESPASPQADKGGMNVLAGIRADALGLRCLPTKKSLAVALILKPHGLIDEMHQAKAAALTVAGAAQVAFKG